MAQKIIYLSTPDNMTVEISSEETELQKGDTVIFIALHGSFKVTFNDCLGLFEDDHSSISESIYQGSKWETPIFRLADGLMYPFEYTVTKIGDQISLSRAQSKKIKAIVG